MLGEVPEKLKNIVILSTRLCQISFNPIASFFSMSRASVWYISRRTNVKVNLDPIRPLVPPGGVLRKNNPEISFFRVDYP